MKFSDIALNISEEEYRNDPALNYSTLAKFSREGFPCVASLFEKEESPSLTFGSIVDTLITGSDDDFNRKFCIADIPELSSTLEQIARRLFSQFHDKCSSITDIPDDVLVDSTSGIQWNNHWQEKTRAKKIKEECREFYDVLYQAGDRSVISPKLYKEALDVVDKLRTTNATRFYFEKDDMFSPDIERFYQLKFKTTVADIEYKCMADEIIVIHSKKKIIPVDLKTTSRPEYEFYKSFLKWRYDIQARLYGRIIEDNVKKSEDFKDYEVISYRFVVASRENTCPLVWTFGLHDRCYPTLIFGKNRDIELKSPFEIGKELKYYLDNKPVVPLDINVDSSNSIEKWIDKM